MKGIAVFFSPRRDFNAVTEAARRRLMRSMPGEPGALASLRLTGIGL